MPDFQRDGATIHDEEFGRGFPILTFAPAGLQSTIEVWSRPAAPINPTTELARNEAHPLPISEELARLLPRAEMIREWKTGDALTSARARVEEFLSKHTPRA